MSSSDPTIWSLVEAAATDHPDRVLLSDEHGRSYTAAALRDAAESVAAGLGVTSRDVVSWQLPTVAESVVLMLALARVGATQNPIIPILREREVGHIVGCVGTTKMIVPETWRGFGHGDLARRLGEGNGYETIVVDLEGEVGKDLRLPQGDPASLPAPPSVGRRRALAVLHLGHDVVAQGRAAQRSHADRRQPRGDRAHGLR